MEECIEAYLKMIKMLDNMDDREYMEAFLSYNTALICAGLKPAVTLTLMIINNRNLYDVWFRYGEYYIGELNLKYSVLRQSAEKSVLIIYDENLLRECLNKKCNAEFLKMFGYREDADINEKLEMLRKRYKEYICPHELGIFLGYPVEDVKAFMTDTRYKCKVCGYWKVYNSVEEAQRIFCLFDKVKNYAVENIIKGIRKNHLSEKLREEVELLTN